MTEIPDLIRRLRERDCITTVDELQAADALEQQQVEIERLRAALTDLTNGWRYSTEVVTIAGAALTTSAPAAAEMPHTTGSAAATVGADPDTTDPIGMDRVLHDIRRKRERHTVVHGYSRLHDDEHSSGELAIAAIPYVQASYAAYLGLTDEELQVFWPWDGAPNLNQPHRELLINAAALIVADIERRDRAAAADPDTETSHD